MNETTKQASNEALKQVADSTAAFARLFRELWHDFQDPGFLWQVMALAICLLLLLSPQRARLSQGVFLVVALFLMLNKVYSPQYVLWLLPLLVLARPRWREWIVFSVAELVYFVAIWAHLDGALYSGGGTQDRLYWLAVGLRVAVQFWLCVQVIRDIVDPRRDIVRAQGADDPDGGVFDGAADAPWLLAARASLVRG